jgi:phage terminase large subunit-like protein
LSILDDLTKNLVDIYSNKLNEQQRADLLESLDVLAKDQKYNVFKNTFPDTGPYSIHNYPKHKEFMNAGATYTERGAIAANRVGKSVTGAFETTCHATGIYPPWWTGKRYHKPTMIWVGGDTAVTCRDIIQYKLLGDIGDFGSGMIPKDLIVETKTRRNVPDAIETIRVRHVSGGITTIVIKTYEQGRAAWQGTEVDFIWIDEECPEDVYGEALIRLMTTNGSIILTFTPLSGLTPLVINFLDNSQETEAQFPKFVANITWKDVPHLDEKQIAKMLESTPENMRKARSEGIPTVGDGNIFPLPFEQITVDDFRLPKYFPKAYGMDVGWNATAAVFGAWDRDSDVIYIYSEYKQGKADPTTHASAIRGRGTWLKGAIDPASRASSQVDGTKLFEIYTRSLERGGGGLKLVYAANAVEAGIFNMWERLQSGRLKIFKSCTQLLREISMYHRKDGKIVKTFDHEIDSCRYLLMADASLWKTPESEVVSGQGNVIKLAQYTLANQ